MPKTKILALVLALLPALPGQAREHDGGVTPPRLLLYAEPAYPSDAKAARVQGDVVLELEVDVRGVVASASVVESPAPSLSEAALSAAREYKFEPARGPGGEPVATIFRFTQHFALAADPEPPRPTPAPERRSEERRAYSSTVLGERAFTSASSAEVRDRDFLLRPTTSPSDILRVMPGLVTAQHQGGGKADQLFLRGFDADHGTDVAVFLDGVPVNLPTHAHGQGYADLHWLIPEVVERVDVRKGPYYAEVGDFGTAGAVELFTRDQLDGSSASLLGGQFGTYRALATLSGSVAGTHPFLAAEVYGSDGPFAHPEGLTRASVFAKDTVRLGEGKLSILLTGYGSAWRASGQLPARWVGCGEPGCIDRFGAFDPTEGGSTQRQMVSAGYELTGGGDTLSLGAYAVRSQLSLYSDFTLQSRDPVHFDEILQLDDRTYSGVTARWQRTTALLGRPFMAAVGAAARYDSIHRELAHTARRAILPSCFDQGPNPCIAADVTQSDLSTYLVLDWEPTRWLRLVAGLRGDLFEWDVNDLRPQAQRGNAGDISGQAQRQIVSPKASAVLTLPVSAPSQVYLDFGSGFHSNDGLSAVSASACSGDRTSCGHGSLPRALGGEVGARTRLFDRVDLAAAAWLLRLESELVFNGDAATTEPSDPSLRKGLDLEVRAQVLPWLFLDGDLTLATARFTPDHGNGGAVALAPRRIATAGLTVRDPAGLGLQGSLRMRHVGDRPANPEETVIAQGYTVFDVYAAYRTRRYEVGVVVENLFNATWREAQFDDTTRLAGPPRSEPAPVEGLTFTPGNPFNARAFAKLFF